MSKGTTYAIIIRADQHAADRYLASCPDIPGWFATGTSADEASSMASEIVRGIIAERRANGVALPEASVQATQVVVDVAGASAASPDASAFSTSVESEESSGSEFEPLVAHNRETPSLEEDGDDKTVFLSS